MTEPTSLRQRLNPWALRAVAAATVLAAAETCCTAALSPLARGSWGLLLRSLLCSVALLLICSLPLAILCALLEPRIAPRLARLLPATPTLVSALCSAVLGALAAHLLHSQVDPARFEFLGPIRMLANALMVAVIFSLVLGTHKLASAWLSATNGAHVQRLLGTSVAAVGLGAVAVLHFGPATVYDHTFDGWVAALAVTSLLFASRLIAERTPTVSHKAVVALLTSLLIAGGLAAQSAPVRYLLVARAPVATANARLLRNLVDFDRDGSAATTLGGADCAAFDAQTGSGMRETDPAADHDCHPNLVPSPAINPVAGPWSDCLTALQTRNKPLDIVILTLDALRADTFAAQMPPALRDIAQDAATFSNAYAPSPATYTSVPALFSGHTVSDLAQPNALSKPVIVAENLVVRAFRAANYRTIGVTLLNREELGDGFDEFGGFAVDPPAPGGGKADFYAGALTQQASQRLTAAGNRPVFLWLHQTDTHAPYIPIERSVFPKPEGTDYERAAAYALLRSTEFLQRVLRQRGDDTVLVISADHGEELSGNGRHGHGPELTEAVLRVPLLLRVPGCPGVHITQPVSLLDVAPALLELAHLAPPRWSLLRAIAGEPRSTPLVAEAFTGSHIERALIAGHHKLRVEVRSGGKVAFNLATDPHEAHNLYGVDAQLTDQLDHLYNQWLSRHLSP